jgi:RNA polymerase sigma-70 factor (ECF subfamily)
MRFMVDLKTVTNILKIVFEIFMAMCSLSDAELWSLIVKDDQHAFTAMFQRHWLTLYKTAHKYVKDEEAAEEIIHDLFLNIWNRRNHLTIHDFNRYFKAAARYQVYAYIKKHKTATLEYREYIRDENEVYALYSAHDKILYQELENQLIDHLKTLPERCREIFFLSRVRQLDNSEIAAQLGISKRSVENQITRALQCVRFNMKNIVMSLLILFSIFR